MTNKYINIGDKTYIESDVIPLPTKTNTGLQRCGVSEWWDCGADKLIDDRWEWQYLYFLSNEEIKREGIWIIENGILYKSSLFDCDEIKPVVIATTDKSLTIDTEIFGKDRYKELPRPSNEFLQRFCKIGGIDKCLIQMEDVGEEDWIGDDYNGEPFWNPHYILKVAPDNTITIRGIQIIEQNLWDDAFRVIWNREVSEGTREAMIREKYNISLK